MKKTNLTVFCLIIMIIPVFCGYSSMKIPHHGPIITIFFLNIVFIKSFFCLCPFFYHIDLMSKHFALQPMAFSPPEIKLAYSQAKEYIKLEESLLLRLAERAAALRAGCP